MIKIDIEIKSPLASVWAALVKPALIKEYFYGTEVISEWKTGSSIRFTGTWEGKPYEDKGTILALEPEKCLSYNYWSNFTGIPDVPENYAIIRFDLLQINSEVTKLQLTQHNSPTPTMEENSAQGWKDVLNNLKKMLENGK
ncbi:MAG: SRPBCC family protein [Cyclobacteriaceae bacterium]|nr:SRPBCC family protein [Cyclobacteriaceae bacterium]